MENSNRNHLGGRISSLILLIIGLFLLWAFCIKGVQVLTILSGSMEPKIPTGSIVCVVPEDYNNIKVGDVISYKENSQIKVTHQVIQIDKGKKELTTKGIANNVADSPISSSKIIGVVKFYIPCPSFLSSYVNYFGTVKIVLIAVAIIGLLSLVKPTHFRR